MKETKEIFISHSGKDKKIVDDFIDLLLIGALGIQIDKIFCTSTDGMKIKSGADWRDSIMGALQQAKVNFLIISPNYKESEVCMNEMGAGWVTSAEVIPLIIEPINYKTVGVIQEPIQIEKLLDEKSLDRIKDILQEQLEIPNSLIKSDRWTAKKKEFVLKTKKYLKENPFREPLDREEFNSLIKEKEELETTLTKLIEEKSELEDLVEDLKKAKDKNEVLEIVKKHSDTTEFEEFQELCQNVEYHLDDFQPIIRGIIFKAFSGKEITINWEPYREDIDFANANDYIDGYMDADFESTQEMKKVSKALYQLEHFINSELAEDFYELYKENYKSKLSLSNMGFWEEVIDVKILI